MKGKLLLLTILVVLFIFFVGAKYLILDRQTTDGKIKVLSSPSATVFINNAAVGHTPYETQLKAGEYELKLIPEGEATSTASWQEKVKVSKNILTYVNRELGSSDITSAGEILTVTKMEKKPSSGTVGEIGVETDPQGAIVYLDSDEKGVAPLILADVPKGSHEISVFMPGFFRRTEKVKVEPGYRVNALFKLGLDQSQKPPAIPTPQKEASQSAKIKKTFILIKDTPTGFLRVRADASVNASESGQLKPGDRGELMEEQGDWYRIKYAGDKTGWVFSQYAQKVEE